jgi:hypothetical protein
MTVQNQWAANRDVIHIAVCVIAIVVGILMFVGAWHVGDAHKAAGVVEVTLGILGLV